MLGRGVEGTGSDGREPDLQSQESGLLPPTPETGRLGFHPTTIPGGRLSSGGPVVCPSS